MRCPPVTRCTTEAAITSRGGYGPSSADLPVLGEVHRTRVDLRHMGATLLSKQRDGGTRQRVHFSSSSAQTTGGAAARRALLALVVPHESPPLAVRCCISAR
jgi:hypothetical protein